MGVLVNYLSMANELRETLKAEFEKRKNKNPKYSMRAFARDLSLNIATVSEFLSNKRDLSRQSFESVRAVIPLPVELEEVHAHRNKVPPISAQKPLQKVVPEEEYRLLIGSWLPYAILNMAEVKSHSAVPAWLARRFGVDEQDVVQSLQILIQLGLTRIEGDRLVRTGVKLVPSSEVSPDCAHSFQRSNLQKALQTLEEIEALRHEFASTTFPLALRDLEEIRGYLRRFRHQVARRFSSGEADAVYCLSLQLFPLSKDPTPRDE